MTYGYGIYDKYFREFQFKILFPLNEIRIEDYIREWNCLIITPFVGQNQVFVITFMHLTQLKYK